MREAIFSIVSYLLMPGVYSGIFMLKMGNLADFIIILL